MSIQYSETSMSKNPKTTEIYIIVSNKVDHTMSEQDIRWKQRFQNFEKAFLFFESAVEKESYTPIEIGGLVQAFEFTFELGWKTVKDYLEEQGIVTRFPAYA